MKTQHAHRVLAVCSLALLAACGGGSSYSPQPALPSAPPSPPVLPTAPPSPFPAPTSASPHYLAAVAGSVGGISIGIHGGPPLALGHLVVVDPLSPITPVALEAAGQWQALAEFKEGAIDTNAKTISNASTRFLVYLKGDRVYRLDLRRGSWPPVPALVSSLTATRACSAIAIHDFQNAQRSWIVLIDGGSDRQCGTADDRQWALRADMAAADPPVSVASEVVGAIPTGDGAISGFVVRDGTQVRKVDAQFGNAIDLFTVAGGLSTRFLSQNFDFPSSMMRGHLLFTEANRLRAYDLTGSSGPGTLLSMGPAEFCCSVVVADAANVYLTVEGQGGARLLRVSDSLTVQVLATESASKIFKAIATPTRIVYSIRDTAGVVYRSVPKAGGVAITIAPAEPCPDSSWMFASGENLWYDCSALSIWDDGIGLPERPFVGVVRSDGTQVEMFENARIARLAHANPLPLIPDSSTIHAVTVVHYAPPAVEAVRAYEGTTATQLVEYADLPSNLPLELPGLIVSTWGMPSLFSATFGAQVQRELFFFQTDSAGVTRVTGLAL